MTRSPVDLKLINPQEFFHDKLARAFASQKLDLGQDVEHYLVNLLCGFVAPNSENSDVDDSFFDTPLALVLKKALEAPPEKRWRIFKGLGDTSLYLSGYFQGYFDRKTFDLDYYIQLGSGAYGNISTGSHTSTERKQVFASLSTNFRDLVEVVAEVSDRLASPDNSNLLAIYDRWTKSRSERLRKKLESHGISPVPNLSSREPQ